MARATALDSQATGFGKVANPKGKGKSISWTSSGNQDRPQKQNESKTSKAKENMPKESQVVASK